MTTSEAKGPLDSSDRDAMLESAARAHDLLAARESVWVGAEPTFTDRLSESREWLCDALGPDKDERARLLVSRLVAAHPGAAVLRTLGRQYESESEPRWSYGIYLRRDGQAAWSGPPDLLSDGPPGPGEPAAATLRAALVERLAQAGWSAAAVESEPPGAARLICRREGSVDACDAARDPRLGRPSVHDGRVPESGPVDELAAEGSYLVLVHGAVASPRQNGCWIELPAFGSVGDFLEFLAVLGGAAGDVGASGLGLRGFPPPVDESVAFTTLTPDPAVLEVNQAPEPDLASFVRASRELFRMAGEVGLSPYRCQYNGAVSDSGGGGQLTFGGPSPEQSPFFESPQLLPRLIRYLIRHPALSYWFATQYVGGSSQSPRPDEGIREAFLELGVALEHLGRLEAPSPQLLWGTLRHFLVDSSGNPHRSELNIEKLKNPYLPGRGELGLVEFRALSMAPSVAHATARAMLLRGLLVLLAREDLVPALRDWGDELHDRFALPFFLQGDLQCVLSDLRGAGLGLPAELEQLLEQRHGGLLGRVSGEGFELSVEQAIEFWPLVGDVASQEAGGSRLVDSSTGRLQVCLRALGDRAAELEGVRVWVNRHRLPLRLERTKGGAAAVMGVRFRSFAPMLGLHPDMPAEGNISLDVHRHGDAHALRVTLHPWRPSGAAYDGLPCDLEDAAARRAERLVVESVDARDLPADRAPPAEATTPFCLDLRRVQGSG